MYSMNLMDKILAIVLLSISIIVVFGAIDPQEENQFKNDDTRIFIRLEPKIVKTRKNETYTKRELIPGKCPNGNGVCMNSIPVNKTRIVSKTETVMVPLYKCREGYKEESNNICVPICKNACEHGNCVAPEHCECDQGYANDKNDLRICNPVCDGCEYGKCISPNNCKCDDNYQWYADHNKCSPICKTNCPNGKCIAPNECTCNENYFFNEVLDSCVPKCIPSCIFGDCISPNECKCYEKYRFKSDSTNECEPICDPSCSNGKCTKPNECQCNNGYQFKIESLSDCEPICDSNCKNGTCVFPNMCQCNEGYHFKNNSSSDCEPICMPNCINGECIASNKCECNDGYQLKTGSLNNCEPVRICTPECENSKCIGPNVCECNIGYEKSSNKSAQNICCPICDGLGLTKDCVNNKCTSGVCQQCAVGQRLTEEANYNKSSEQLLRKNDNLPTAESGFNWWIVLGFGILLVVSVIILVAYRCYRNRKIDYYIGSGAEATIHYDKNEMKKN